MICIELPCRFRCERSQCKLLFSFGERVFLVLFHLLRFWIHCHLRHHPQITRLAFNDCRMCMCHLRFASNAMLKDVVVQWHSAAYHSCERLHFHITLDFVYIFVYLPNFVYLVVAFARSYFGVRRYMQGLPLALRFLGSHVEIEGIPRISYLIQNV